MTVKTVHWLLASGVALGVHGLLLMTFVRPPPPLVEVAGGRIEVNFGNSGRNTANAAADRGSEPTAETETPSEALDPAPADILPEVVQPEPEPEHTPDDAAEPEPAPVKETVTNDLPDKVEPPPVMPLATIPESPVDEPAPSTIPLSHNPADLMEQGTSATSQSEDGEDATDSVASPTSGSPSAAATAENTNLQPGDSDASNYAGKIVGILSRKRLPSSVPRGSAMVSFSMANDGDIVNIEIADSSGSKRFDRAAMRLIKAAAPFPRPPRGAMLDYTVVIKKD
ncbi:MAG: TonB family protein [Pseudomonadota bacterium]